MIEVLSEQTTAIISANEFTGISITGDSKAVVEHKKNGGDPIVLFIDDFIDTFVEGQCFIFQQKIWELLTIDIGKHNTVLKGVFVGLAGAGNKSFVRRQISLAISAVTVANSRQLIHSNPDLVNGTYGTEFWEPVLAREPNLVTQLINNPLMKETFNQHPGLFKSCLFMAVSTDPFVIDLLPVEMLVWHRYGPDVVAKAIDSVIYKHRNYKLRRKTITFDVPEKLKAEPRIAAMIQEVIDDIIDDAVADKVDWLTLPEEFGNMSSVRKSLSLSSGFVNWLEKFLTRSTGGYNQSARHHLPKWVNPMLLADIMENCSGMEDSNIAQLYSNR